MADFGASEIAIAGVAASVIGTGVSVMGQQAQAQAQSEQEKYQAQIAANNAILADRAAQQSVLQGQQNETNQAIAGKELIAKQVTTLAGNAVDPFSGSPLNLISSQAAQNEVGQATTRTNAANTANEFQGEASNFNAQSAADTLAAQNTAAAGPITALGGAFSGVGSVASKWYKYSPYGTGDSTGT